MLENTVYDKVYKTMLHDKPRWIIPMINEVFGEHYKGEERIEFLEGTHYIKDADGKLVERATDSYFRIMDERRETFHFEVQSTPDPTMVQRVYEYESAIAYMYRRVDGSKIIVQFPPSAVLFLRHTKSTPDVMEIVVQMKGDTVIQKVPVMKLGNYTLEKIFEKRLYILICFHIFVYENKFMMYNGNGKQLEKLIEAYRKIKEHLDMLVKNGELDEYDRFLLIDMTVKVVGNLAEKFENIVQGIKEVVMGVEFDYLSREEFYQRRAEIAALKEEGRLAARNEGFVVGRNEGVVVGERKAYLAMFKKGILSLAEVAKELNTSEEALKQYL